MWGLGAALAALALFLITHVPVWGAIAHIGAWINLFNLIPIWQLDGAHGFHAMSQPERWWAVATIGAAWILTHEGMLLALLLVAAWAALKRDAPARGDRRAVLEYAFLILTLALIAQINVPTA
jgi:Zn-dependent protease